MNRFPVIAFERRGETQYNYNIKTSDRRLSVLQCHIDGALRSVSFYSHNLITLCKWYPTIIRTLLIRTD